MSIAIVTLLSLAILIIGFLVGWLVGGLVSGFSGMAFMALPVLVIGFLIGWLVEWIIDNQYRRMRELSQEAASEAQAQAADESGSEVAELAHVIKEVLAEREEEVSRLQRELERQEARYAALEERFDRYVATHPDDLTAIKGIGRIYQWKLRDAGISTYAQLAATTPEYIREVLQVKPWQRVDPESWIEQARVLAQQG